MRTIYGIEIKDTANDKHFQMVKRVADIGEVITVPGRFIVEVIPWLRYIPSWFPGAGFKTFAFRAYTDMWAVVDELFADAKVAMVIPILSCPQHNWLKHYFSAGQRQHERLSCCEAIVKCPLRRLKR